MANINIITRENGELVVRSKEVAKNFDRNHYNIIRSINSMIKFDKSVKDLFIESEFSHSVNKKVFKEYLITEEGFKLVVNQLTKKNPMLENEYIQAFNEKKSNKENNFAKKYNIEQKERFGISMYEIYSIGSAIGLHKERVDLILNNSTINPICMDNKKYFTKNDLLAFMGLARTSQCEPLKKWLEGNTLEEKQEVLESLTEGQSNDEVLSKAFIMAQKIISDKDKQIEQLEKKVDKFKNALLQVMQQFNEDLEN